MPKSPPSPISGNIAPTVVAKGEPSPFLYLKTKFKRGFSFLHKINTTIYIVCCTEVSNFKV